MAIKFVSVTCPNCLANLNIDSSRTFTYCAHCGTKILMSNDNEHIYRHIDEAKLKEAETDRLIRLQELKLQEMEMRKEQELKERRMEEERQARLREEEAKERRRTWKIIAISIGACVILLIVFAAIAFLMILSPEEREKVLGFGALFVMIIVMYGAISVMVIFGKKGERTPNKDVPMIMVTSEMLSCAGMPVERVRTMYAQAGFRNVSASPVRDLTLFTLRQQGQVSAVFIGGKEVCQVGMAYPENAQVVIFYHSRGSSLL